AVNVLQPGDAGPGAITGRAGERVGGVVEQNIDVAGRAVADDDVETLPAIHVAEGYVRRADPDGEGSNRAVERAAGSLGGDGDAAAQRVGDDKVVETVTVEVGGGHSLRQTPGSHNSGASEGSAAEDVHGHRIPRLVAGGNRHPRRCPQRREVPGRV